MTDRVGTWAALISTLLLVVSLVGGLTVVSQYRSLSEHDDASEEIIRMRNGMFSVVDLSRLRASIEEVANAPGPEARDEALARLSDAVDYLYVRADTFRKSLGPDPLPSALQIVDGLDSMIAALDAALGEPDRIFEVRAEFDRRAAPVLAGIGQFYDDYKRRHILALTRQASLLWQMVITAVGLILLFMLIALTAVFFWQRELKTRMKRMAAEDRAHRLAYFDPLTGLANRASFMLDAERALITHEAPALLLLDVDDFKSINDTHGHHAGDALLRAVADRAGARLGVRGGFVARLGGDEFAAILPQAGARQDLSTFAQDLVVAVADPFTEDGLTLSPRISVGVATPDMLTDGTPDLNALMRAADYALYKAKADGRFTSRIYDADMADTIARRRRLKEEMPVALENGDFFVQFQPQVRLRDGALHGFEALARWRREGAIVPPGTFIDIAEEDDFIIDLDAWVLRAALAEAMTWNRTKAPPVNISVNLSAVNFRNPGIVASVQQALDASGLPPAQLTLEITESTLIEDWSATRDILSRLSSLGLKIALDDFGTGFSSLSYLRRLSVDEVKIDRAFVVDIERSDRTRMMLDALVDIARGLEMQLIIEGIETAGQAEIVERLGGDIGQGFLFSQPIDAETARRIAARPDFLSATGADALARA